MKIKLSFKLKTIFWNTNTENRQHSTSSAFSQPTTPTDFIVFIVILLSICSKYLFSFFNESKTLFYLLSLIYYICIMYTQKIIQRRLNYYNDRLFLTISYVSFFSSVFCNSSNLHFPDNVPSIFNFNVFNSR